MRLLPKVFVRSAVALLFGLSITGTASSHNSPHNYSLQDLSNFRQQLAQLERRYGNYDQRLAEPLSRLGAALSDTGFQEEAAHVLDRALQIIKANHGLFTEQQLPVIKSAVRNYISHNSWDEANEALDHLEWLYLEKFNGPGERLVGGLMELGDIHMEAVVMGQGASQAGHLTRAVQLRHHAVVAARQAWGPDDSRQIPVLYSLALGYYNKRLAIEQGGSTSYALRDVLYPGDGALSRKRSLSLLYRAGLEALREIRRITAADTFAESRGNAEALAMTELALADWKLLHNRDEKLAESYEQVYAELEAAGVPEEGLEYFFLPPAVLPMPRLALSVQEGIEARVSQVGAVNFEPWSADFPGLPRPELNSGLDFARGTEEAPAVTVLQLEQGPLAARRQWYRGRYRSVLGTVAVPEEAAPQGDAAHLQFIRFRPALVEGRLGETAFELRYRHP